jgi:hypothetical protein
MTGGDRFRLGLGYYASLIGLAFVGCGIAMFWGPLRQVLAAPLIIGGGVIAYLLGRWQVWGVRQEIRQDGERET